MTSRVIVNARVEPTLEVDIITDAGQFRSSLYCTRRHERSSVLNWTDIIKSQLSPLIIGVHFSSMEQIEDALSKFSPDIQRTIYQALYQALAAYNRMTYCQYIRQLTGSKPKMPKLVFPMVANPSSSILEYGITFYPDISVQDQINYSTVVFKELQTNYSKNQVQDGMIQLNIFDSEEPVKTLKNILKNLELNDKVGIYLKFNSEQYDKNTGSFDFHIHEDSKLRENMQPTQLSQTISVLVSNNPVLLVDNVLQFSNGEIEMDLETNFGDKIHIINKDPDEGQPQIYRNCEHRTEASFQRFQDILSYKTNNSVMFEIVNDCEDDTMAHVVMGMGCEFIKIYRSGQHHISKLNEILRLCPIEESRHK